MKDPDQKDSDRGESRSDRPFDEAFIAEQLQYLSPAYGIYKLTELVIDKLAGRYNRELCALDKIHADLKELKNEFKKLRTGSDLEAICANFDSENKLKETRARTQREIPKIDKAGKDFCELQDKTRQLINRFAVKTAQKYPWCDGTTAEIKEIEVGLKNILADPRIQRDAQRVFDDLIASPEDHPFDPLNLLDLEYPYKDLTPEKD